MLRLSLPLILVHLVMAAAIASCSRNEIDDPSTALQPFSVPLPPVATLPVGRDLSFTNSDRTMLGDEYDNALPSSNIVVAGADRLSYQPTTDGTADALSDYAFALYSF